MKLLTTSDFRAHPDRPGGFTLIEIMIALTILTLVVINVSMGSEEAGWAGVYITRLPR